MYRLLIVSENDRVHSMFDSIQGWEVYGFKPPHFRADVPGARECMQHHEINAVGVDFETLSPDMREFLEREYPNTPIFPVLSDADRQMDVLRKLSRMLNRLTADDSNDSIDAIARLQEQRDCWMRRLMCGLKTKEDLDLDLCLYRSPEGTDVPCSMTLATLPEDDFFLNERWHYGGERLETALRNFFGREHGNMRIYVALPSRQELRVLVCPKDGLLDFSEAEHFIQETVNQIDNYIELKLAVKQSYRLSGLQDLAIKKEKQE